MRKRSRPDEDDLVSTTEEQANTLIANLIQNIQMLTDRKDPLISNIVSPKLLVRGLEELKSMVEMVDIKQSIVHQIKFLITNQARNSDSKFEGHMLHSVISGNPGTGKTTVGMILAKIWMSLGFVKSKNSDTSPLLITPVTNTIGDLYRNRISELEQQHQQTNRKLGRVQELLSQYHIVIGEIRRNLIRLRSDPAVEDEWNHMHQHVRNIRFGFDEMIREAHLNDIESSEEEEEPAIDDDPYEHEDPKFVIASREDFIAEYLGQTAPKTKKVLESARGGVLFIDEAYSLCNVGGGSKDKYGEECLTTINEFMSQHPDEIIIIFAGYKDKLMDSIFKVQPGLYRRCMHFFEIKDYSSAGLAKILGRQLAKDNWILHPSINLISCLESHKNLLPDGGGGTEKLSFFLKIAYGACKFDQTVLTPEAEHNSVITKPMLKHALILLEHSLKDHMIDDSPPDGIYL